jgi:hypothetical protein
MTSQCDLREAPPIAPLIRSQSPVSPPLAISVQELEAQWQVFDSLLHELRERRVRPETYAFGSGTVPSGLLGMYVLNTAPYPLPTGTPLAREGPQAPMPSRAVTACPNLVAGSRPT